MDIRKSEIMPTRPCDYCLAMQDDSVFADFNIDESNCLYLVKISFDGFGSCEPKPGIGKIDLMNSMLLISVIESSNFPSPKVSEILRDYFRENKNNLWQDALIEHELI